MLISLRSDHKEHLNLLVSQSTRVLIDFCKLALDFLQNGPNLKLYGTASEKLSIPVESLENCINGLVNLLILSCKHNLNEADFRDSILTIGFSLEQQSVLYKFYESKKKEVTEVISRIKINEPHYHDLDWRLEVQLGSRALHVQTTPLIALELTLKTVTDDDEVAKQRVMLQSDVTNLIHVVEELENALLESKSKHCRRVQRSLNNS